MANVLLTPNAKQQFFTLAGVPAAGYKLYTWLSGTAQVTPQATYSNRAGSAANANPIILNARGEATVYLTPGVVYDYSLKSAADVPEWTQEGVSAQAGEADAVNYTASGTGTVERLLSAKLDEWKSVQDFGAVGDGVADDTAALQAAITQAGSGAYDLLFPAGTYKTTSTLTSTGSLTLRGDGRATITKATTGDILSGESVVVSGVNFTHTGTSGRLLNLVGGGARAEGCNFINASGNASDMVHCTSSDHYFGRNYFTNNDAAAFCIHVERTSAGMCINGSISGRNTFGGIGKGVKWSSSVVGQRPEGWTFDGNTVILTGQQHLRVETVLHLAITNNMLDQSSLYCVELAPNADGIDSVSIEGNYLATAAAPTTGVAIETVGGTGGIFNLRVHGNHFEQSGYGLALNAKVAEFTVTGNTFANITNSSVYHSGAQRGTIGFNTFRGGNVHLSLIDGATGLAISVIGNSFPSTGSVVYTPTDRAHFEFYGNTGKKFSGWCSATGVATAGTVVAVTVPHGLAVTPSIDRIVSSVQQVTGDHQNTTVKIASVDATNVVVGIYYTITTPGNLRVNLHVSA